MLPSKPGQGSDAGKEPRHGKDATIEGRVAQNLPGTGFQLVNKNTRSLCLYSGTKKCYAMQRNTL